MPCQLNGVERAMGRRKAYNLMAWKENIYYRVHQNVEQSVTCSCCQVIHNISSTGVLPLDDVKDLSFDWFLGELYPLSLEPFLHPFLRPALDR